MNTTSANKNTAKTAKTVAKTVPKSPKKVDEDSKVIRKKAQTTHGFTIYIQRVLKQVHPDTGISKNGVTQLNSIITSIGEELSKRAREVTVRQKKQTVTPSDVQFAVNAILPEQLAKHATSEGQKAVTKFKPEKQEKGARGPLSHKAGITFPPTRSVKLLKASSNLRVGKVSGVYLAAVLEYLSAEMLELAGNTARDNKKMRITPRHIFLAVSNDEELKQLFANLNMEIAGVGVTPYVKPEEDEQKKKTYRKKATTVKKDGPKQHRFRPGTVALREIKQQQKATDLNLQHAPFHRVVKEIAGKDIRFGKDVSKEIQGFVESTLATMFKNAKEFASHAGRKGITVKDMELSIKFSPHSKLFTKMEGTSQEISKPGLKRIARRGGVGRIDSRVYEVARQIVYSIVEKLVGRALQNVTIRKIKTVTPQVLKDSLADLNATYIIKL